MKWALILGGGGAVLGTLAAFLAMPVLAPGALLLAGNMGMASGLLMATSFALLNTGREWTIPVGLITGMAALAAFLYSGIKAADSFDVPLKNGLQEKMTQAFGQDFVGLKTGERIYADIKVFGNAALPVIAVAKSDVKHDFALGKDDVYIRACVDFNVTHKDDLKKPAYEVQVCNRRIPAPEEIKRMMLTLR